MELNEAIYFAKRTDRGIRNLNVTDWKIYKKVTGQSLFNTYAVDHKGWELEPEYRQLTPMDLALVWDQLHKDHFINVPAADSSAFRGMLKNLGFTEPFTLSKEKS